VDVARFRIGLDLLADFRARDVGQHQVEKHERGGLVADEPDRVAAMRRREHFEAGLAEIVFERSKEIALVFDD
jgi:hypothetical protein